MREIPKGIWVLGCVSLFMDISSELIHALLPVYLVTVMSVSMVTVGIIEGIAEATASIVKIFSGAMSDGASMSQPSLFSKSIRGSTSTYMRSDRMPTTSPMMPKMKSVPKITG